MDFWWILFIFDGILFFFVALTVLYVLVFTIANVFGHHNEFSKAKYQKRFIIIIPAHRKDEVILQSINSVLGQTYPQRLFDIVVVSDHESEMTNMRLAQLPITLLTPDFDKSSKTKSIQYAILNLPQFKIYDAVIVLDADNIIESEFLEQVNDAFESAGTKAIQVHRLSRNRDTSIARLDTIFEEINNAIFRRGHNALGLSSALNGSGAIYDFEWFKEHIMKVRTDGGTKELEAMLLKEDIYIDYFETIHVYDEKTRKIRSFKEQRGRWGVDQLHSLINNLRYLPWSIVNHHYDFADKIIQWILIPRTIVMGIIMVMGIFLPFIYFSMVIKWWAAGAVLMFAYSLATPDELVDKNWDRDFLNAPIVIMWGLLNILHVGASESETRIKSTSRFVRMLLPKKK